MDVVVADKTAIQSPASGPPRNGQRAAINWAEQYTLGAIAQLGERLRHAGGRRFKSGQLRLRAL